MKPIDSRWRLWGIALLLIAVAITLWWGQTLTLETITTWMANLGPMAWVVFLVIYILATILFFPGALLTLAGGALFGPFIGTLLNLTGATLGALCAFLLARHLGAAWVQRSAGSRLATLMKGVAQEGWRFVAFVRLVPLFPFNLLNYALGLTGISWLSYLLTTWICMLPGALAYTWLGYVGREAAIGGEDLIHQALLALGLLATVLFLPRFVQRIGGKKT
ncbi:TVP38/TMEM64 family protein [Magnetococcus sp. PR-3]|uniref:TVP38/TMEM64 family protein n=1 Tax=Magnetococcus sp. PR-3 TaxID=3120355 RepID=UPI002FCE0820